MLNQQHSRYFQTVKIQLQLAFLKMLKTQLRNKPVYAEVPFKEALSKEHVCYAVTELIKSLIFQRRQIPQTVDSLRKEIK